MPPTIGNPHEQNLWRKYQQLTLISSFMVCALFTPYLLFTHFTHYHSAKSYTIFSKSKRPCDPIVFVPCKIRSFYSPKEPNLFRIKKYEKKPPTNGRKKDRHIINFRSRISLRLHAIRTGNSQIENVLTIINHRKNVAIPISLRITGAIQIPTTFIRIQIKKEMILKVKSLKAIIVRPIYC